MTKNDLIKRYVSNKISYILSSKEINGILANLRRGANKPPGEIPSLFGFVLKSMPESFYSRSGTPTKEEWACYIALVLFAIHQQGHNPTNECMHAVSDEKHHYTVGTALVKLLNDKNDFNAENNLLKRMQAVLDATDIEGVFYYLIRIIRLISKEGIKLDYAALASDIYKMQFEDSKNKVVVKWTQDFYYNL